MPRKRSKTAKNPKPRPSRLRGLIDTLTLRDRKTLRGKLLYAALLGVIVLAGLYAYVDYKVKTMLPRHEATEVPAIYSDPFKVSRALAMPASLLKEQLMVRGYREVPGKPGKPGDFAVAGDGMKIWTRDFQLPSGSTRKAAIASYPIEDESELFYLEPRIIAPLGTGDQRAAQEMRLADMPRSMQNAVMAIEDERFRSHHGIDIVGIARAVFVNVTAMKLKQGGSTLTQQLAKNVLFSPKRTVSRKILEMLAAWSIETRFTKDQILEMYLNEVYLGQEGAVALHGVAEAAKSFFGKKLSDVTLAEAAMLAGIIKAPSYYSPRHHLNRARKRMEMVLTKMEELGFASPPEAQAAKKAKIKIQKEIRFQRAAPYFITAVRTALEEQLGADAALLSGMRVYTGISLEMQACAEKAVDEGMARLAKQHPALGSARDKFQAALVAIEPYSGLVRTWVGGRDFGHNQFNHVNQAQRQIGSTIKPFLYLTALDSSLNSYKTATTMSILSDEPVAINQVKQRAWEPENYDRRFRGDVTLRYALENSLNLPAVYVGQKVGTDSFAATVEKFKLGDRVLAVPSLALGALDTTLLKLTGAYAALANEGEFIMPRIFISAIGNGDEVLIRDAPRSEQIASPEAVYVLTDILRGVLDRGTARSVRALGYKRVAAGKTGTSDNARDAWFVGFTPTLAAGVWVGRDDNEKIGVTGSTAAAPIWTQFMKCAEPYYEPLSFIKPDGVVALDIDTESGGIATDECPRDSVAREVFVRGTEPLGACRLHEGAPIREREPDHAPARPSKRRQRSVWEMLFG